MLAHMVVFQDSFFYSSNSLLSCSMFIVIRKINEINFNIVKFFFKDFIYLFMRDTQREKSRDTGRGRSRLHAGSPTRDSIPGLQDHALD